MVPWNDMDIEIGLDLNGLGLIGLDWKSYWSHQFLRLGID